MKQSKRKTSRTKFKKVIYSTGSASNFLGKDYVNSIRKKVSPQLVCNDEGQCGFDLDEECADNLEVLRNIPEFQEVWAMARSNPEDLQPMLEYLWMICPQVVRLIHENKAEFLYLICGPVEENVKLLFRLVEGFLRDEERERIKRLKVMGFGLGLVLEAFFACNKNEELAAKYMSDHKHEFDD